MKTGFLSNLIGGKGAEIITSVGEVADRFITTPHEKEQFNADVQKEINRHVEAMTESANKELELHLKDMDSARDMNVRVQESEKASWLSKNIAFIIDAFVFIIWGTMTVYLIAMMMNLVKADAGADVSGVLGVYSGVTAIAMTVLNYHRGTSIGSKENGAAIRKIASK